MPLCIYSAAAFKNYIKLLVFSALVSWGYQQTVSFSTKTPYRFSEYTNVSIQRPDTECKAVQINMVFRHGTRYPSNNDIIKMNKMLRIIRSYVDGHKDIADHIKRKLNLTLKCPFNKNIEKLLTPEGGQELYNIGVRFRERFPEIFASPFSVNDLEFSSTCMARSSRSASAFSVGFLEGKGPVSDCKIQPVALKIRPCNDDEILRYFDLCEKYIKYVENNATSDRELNEYMNGPEVANVVKKVRKKLGIENNTRLSPNDVKSMYLSCAYDVGIYNAPMDSGWCQLFDADDFDVMEYSQDLKVFYKRSWAYKITYQSSCPLLRDIFHSVQAAAGRKSDYKVLKGVFRSSHAETIIPLYALLGLFIDKQYLMDNNFEDMKNRKFRGSKIAPFAGNIAFVLYNCMDGYKIQLYNNEKLLKIPCCESEVDCPLEVFERCYEQIVDQCNFDKMCRLDAMKDKVNDEF